MLLIKKNKGSVLMVSLWVLAILAMFSLSISQQAILNIKISRYQKDRLKADFLSRAGIRKAIRVLEKSAAEFDYLESTWSTGRDPVTEEMLLDNIELPLGCQETFSVKYLFDLEKNIYLCMADEERKVNLNKSSQSVLLELLKYNGIDGAQEIADDIRFWRGDSVSGIDPESEEYKNFKRSNFSNPEELVIVLEYFYQNKGEQDYRLRAQETFATLRGRICVFAEAANLNTVSRDTLMILALSLPQDSGIGNVYTAVNNLISRRDAVKFFKSLDLSEIGIDPNSQEGKLLNKLKDYNLVVLKSDYFRIESSGCAGKTIKKITAVYRRSDKKMVYWYQN